MLSLFKAPASLNPVSEPPQLDFWKWWSTQTPLASNKTVTNRNLSVRVMATVLSSSRQMVFSCGSTIYRVNTKQSTNCRCVAVLEKNPYTWIIRHHLQNTDRPQDSEKTKRQQYKTIFNRKKSITPWQWQPTYHQVGGPLSTVNCCNISF